MNLARAFFRGRGLWWSLLRLSVLLLFLVVLPVLGILFWVSDMPGESAGTAMPPPTTREEALQLELRATIETLAGEIGERNIDTSGSLNRATGYLIEELEAAGYQVEQQHYLVKETTCTNLIAEVPGKVFPQEVVVVGAHYDSVYLSPGADDNGSGTAAVLALARSYARTVPRRTVRFLFFVNEESPFGLTPQMGSYVYAATCRRRGDQIIGMMSIESIGYFSDEPDSQQYPSEAFKTLYPSTGNFVAFVSDSKSRRFLRSALSYFRKYATVPSQGAALPRGMAGVGWSDHWSFWVHGYPGVMVTGTAPFRNPNYHTQYDLPDTISYDRLARVVAGLEKTVDSILSE